LLSLGLAFLVLCALPAQSADLTRIERGIAKEPNHWPADVQSRQEGAIPLTWHRRETRG